MQVHAAGASPAAPAGARRREHLEHVQWRAARGAARMLGQQEGRHGAAVERREELARR